MKIYEASVRKPITTLLLFVGVVIFGLYSLKLLPIDMYPKMDPPYITVMSYYQGASAADIEENITQLVEDNLNTVPELKKLTSTSRENISLVMLEFEWGANLDEAMNNVRDAMSRITRSLPEGVENPTIFKFSTDMMPILAYTATAEESFAVLPELMKDVVGNPLNRIAGVGAISISGGGERKVMVDIDPNKLEAYNLTVEQIGSLLARENMNVPSGSVDVGSNTFAVRVDAQFPRTDILKDLIVGQYNGAPVYLRDVAKLTDSLDKQTYIERSNGRNSVRMNIQKQSGANTVQVVKDIKAELPNLVKNLPPDVRLQEVYDSADEIQRSIDSLTETVLFAGLFVVLVVLFFLGRWRATLIIIITIPISLVAAFAYLNLSGNSINIISLSSLSIAIGMVVDDAIVVLENVTSHLEKGSSPREAAIYGTNEVALAVVASTLTVIAVFLPLTMISGLSGIMFGQLGASVTLVITVSIVAALTLTPMLASRILKPMKRFGAEKGKENVVQRAIRAILEPLDTGYAKLLEWATTHRWTVVLLAVLIFVGSLFLAPRIRTEFMPQSDNSRIRATINLPVGVSVDHTKTMVDTIESTLWANVPELQLLATNYGAAGEDNLFAAFGSSGTNIITIDMRLCKPAQRSRTMFDITDQVRALVAQFPQVDKYKVSAGGGGGMGGMGGAPTINVQIAGHDLDRAFNLAQQLKGKIKAIPGVRDVDIDREEDKRQLEVRFDREKLALHGLNSATAGQYVRNRINGMIATLYREGGKEYDVLVRYEEQFRENISDIENITLYSATGQPFKLRDVAKVEYSFATPSIRRENRQRITTVSCTMLNASLSAIVDGIWKAVDEVGVPADMSINIAGSAKDQQESNEDLSLLFLLVVILVYIVMASQFESFSSPFIIMLSLPFALSGVLLALWLADSTLNMISLIGAIMLVGIVVKNGIVLVDYTNLLRERGFSTVRAVVAAGKSRLRPVLMTSMTTILGMVPLAVSSGEGSELWKPMGIAVIGGLIVSTILTLVVVPTVYAIFVGSSIRSSRRHMRRRIRKGE